MDQALTVIVAALLATVVGGAALVVFMGPQEVFVTETGEQTDQARCDIWRAEGQWQKLLDQGCSTENICDRGDFLYFETGKCSESAPCGYVDVVGGGVQCTSP
jgi:hypothetical protein